MYKDANCASLRMKIYTHIKVLPRVLGAVAARCLHLNVLSKKSSLSFASEYLVRSSMFWPEVPRNLENKGAQCQQSA